MSRMVTYLSLIASVCLLSQSLAYGGNSVVVDSKTFNAGQTACSVGVWITNVTTLSALTAALEFRETSPPAYPAGSLTRNFRTGGRVKQSGLGDGIIERTLGVPAGTNSCSGPDSHTFATNAAFDAASPDGMLFACFVQTNPYMRPGSDSVDSWVDLDTDGDGVKDDSALVPAGPSILITFKAGDNPGFFVIDSCCVTPANHVEYVDPDNISFKPAFTKGLIEIKAIADVQSLESGVIPLSYELDQNYPNPFNAGTVIRFSLPHDSRVNLMVFNIIGQRVRTLADDEMLTMGVKSVEWDGRNSDGQPVPSGMYFYRLHTDDFTQTRPMILLK